MGVQHGANRKVPGQLIGYKFERHRVVWNADDPPMAARGRRHRVATSQPLLDVEVEAPDDAAQMLLIDDRVRSAESPSVTAVSVPPRNP